MILSFLLVAAPSVLASEGRVKLRMCPDADGDGFLEPKIIVCRPPKKEKAFEVENESTGVVHITIVGPDSVAIFDGNISGGATATTDPVRVVGTHFVSASCVSGCTPPFLDKSFNLFIPQCVPALNVRGTAFLALLTAAAGLLVLRSSTGHLRLSQTVKPQGAKVTS